MGPGYLWIRFGQGYDGYTATMAGTLNSANSTEQRARQLWQLADAAAVCAAVHTLSA
jgi:hypothetical protein